MFTDWEVTPLKARLRLPSLVLAFAGFAISPLVAQSTKTGDRVMIPTLQSADKELGVQAAEAIRNQLTKQTNLRDLVVVPKADLNNSLQSSGYSTTEPLAPGDAKALATLVRAPQYLEGSVSKTPTGFKIESRLIIARDMTKGQVLPVAQGAKLDDAANLVAKAIKDARRQLPDEETCHNNFSQGKYQDAVNGARAALARNGSANILAMCLAESYDRLHQADSAIAVAERVRASDPRSIPALRLLATTYRSKIDSPRPGVTPAELTQDTTKLLQSLAAMAAADPTNIKLVQDVINTYPQLHRPKDAIPLVRDLLQNNPGDPALLNQAWLVYLNAGNSTLMSARNQADTTEARGMFQSAVDVGTEMARVDTAQATIDYYRRLMAAYSALQQPQKASEVAALATRKFPNDPTLSVLNANNLYKSGQLQLALDAVNKILAADPKNANGYFLKAQIQAA